VGTGAAIDFLDPRFEFDLVFGLYAILISGKCQVALFALDNCFCELRFDRSEVAWTMTSENQNKIENSSTLIAPSDLE
jgi:hypothetical protein